MLSVKVDRNPILSIRDLVNQIPMIWPRKVHSASYQATLDKFGNNSLISLIQNEFM